jgi:hypothetical protein
MIFICNITVYAAQAQSGATKVTVNGYTYSYYSSIGTFTSSTTAYAEIDATSSVPTGYMGGLGRLYNSAGTLVKSGSWWYNDVPCWGIGVESGSYLSSGTFYSKSQVKLYNGNGYTTYTCNASPNLQRSLASIISTEEYKVNEEGLTYGSDYYAKTIDESPELICVLGLNGIKGYVYAEELYNSTNSLEEVLEYVGSEHQDYTIPVYDVDGETLVDYFEISATK